MGASLHARLACFIFRFLRRPQYEATELWLAATQTRSFAAAAITPNQRAVAGGLDGMNSNAVRTAVAGVSTDAQAQDAYDQLSGDMYASTKTVLLDDSRFVRQATSRQLAGESETPVWVQTWGDWNDLEGDGNAAGVRRNTGGLFIGTDGRLADAFRMGVVSGFGHSTVRAGDGRGKVKVDTYSLGVYGGEQWGAFRLGLGLDQAWHQLSSSRNVAFKGFSDTLSADYRGRTTQAWGDAGYRFTAGDVVIEPFAGLAYVYLNTPGFSESGGAAALHFRGDDTQVTFSTLGVKSNTAFDVRDTAVTASGLVGWRHSLKAVTPSDTSRFADGDNFVVAGIPVARDVAVMEAGLDVATGKNSTLGIHYAGQLGSGTSDNGVRVMYGMQF
ncbi:autotransporter outer membrane beta-barrel domain-containing protein [Kluyvera georgiana]|uniref:autotransporter outer membrane beta-barrel domain-containing protein n=1 Tax=Kluyvera georgiana TaxID=73098 RepID=UPI003F67C089